ncbi:MAG: aspartate kinase, partial [Gammaproteobacteria bacterium]|nr:aspartate kinase [Gammaproteobacteria bacterium]
MNRLLQELKNVFRGLTIIHELTPRAMDKVLSYGELFSRMIIVHALASLGLSPVAISASECIITDDHFGQAKVDWTRTEKAIGKNLLPYVSKEQIPVMQGFIGGTESGTVTTLGRGGSDYTAAIIGAICKANEIQIWTDVNGFLTADPSIIPEASTIPELNIYEARELAHFGARVLHPKSVLPAIERDIPVYIKNTFEPDHEGTLLSDNENAEGIHGMTALKNLCLISLDGNQSDSDSVIPLEQQISPEVFLR